METGATVSAPNHHPRRRRHPDSQAGDNVRLDLGTSLSSGRHLKIHRASATRATSTTSATTITVNGSLSSNEVEIAGPARGRHDHLAATALAGHVRVLGDTDGLPSGDDTITVDHLPSMTTNARSAR